MNEDTELTAPVASVSTPTVSSTAPARNRLSNALRFKLAKWLETNEQRFTDERVSIAQAAAQATAALNFNVSPEHVRTVMGVSEGCLIHHVWNAVADAGRPERTPTDNRKLNLIVQVVEEILKQVGGDVDLPADLKSLWKELVEGSPVPTATPAQEEQA